MQLFYRVAVAAFNRSIVSLWLHTIVLSCHRRGYMHEQLMRLVESNTRFIALLPHPPRPCPGRLLTAPSAAPTLSLSTEAPHSASSAATGPSQPLLPYLSRHRLRKQAGANGAAVSGHFAHHLPLFRLLLLSFLPFLLLPPLASGTAAGAATPVLPAGGDSRRTAPRFPQVGAPQREGGQVCR